MKIFRLRSTQVKTKLFALALILLPLMTLAPEAHAVVPGEKRMLMVSAYYSPLPNQSFYMRGSYAADIRLNGRGTNGADGTPVYTGLLAAPRTYPFGTRIVIPGLGVGEVHDRGGAIKARKSYDRIDVWMGYGEEGLSRALNWGMRLVEGEVYWTAHQVEPGLSFSHVNSQLPSRRLNQLKGKTLINPQTFTQPITKASPKTSIRDLQEALRLFGFYKGEVNGVYTSDTRAAVLAFQVSEGVIPHKNAVGAGYFGPKTQKALKTKSENFNSKVTKEQSRLRDNIKTLTVGLGKSAKGDKVESLQQMLWELGYYRADLNGVYDAMMIDAVLDFQKDYGVVKNDWEYGAGYFGKKTHEALVAAVDEKAKKIASYPLEMQVWVPAKVDLPKLNHFDSNLIMPGRSHLTFDPNFVSFHKPTKKLFVTDIDLNDRGLIVTRMQDVLIKKGFLTNGLNTGYFGAKTQKALIQFQLDQGLIKSQNSAGAGRVGPKTRALLNTYL